MLKEDNIIDNIHNNIGNIHNKKPVHIHLFNLSDLKEEEEEEKSYIKITPLPPKTPLEILEHQQGYF